MPLPRLLLLLAAPIAFLMAKQATPDARCLPTASCNAKSTQVSKDQLVHGIAFHLCSCSLPCPCLFNGKDEEGCNVVKVYHYTSGGYIGKQIVNRTVVVVPHPKELQDASDAPRANGQAVNSVIYLPPGLTPQQEQDLLSPIMELDLQFGFQNTIRRHANIQFRATAQGYEVTIPGIFHAITARAIGINGKQIIVSNIAAAEGARWFFGRTKLHTYQDGQQPAWKWNLPNKMGSWTLFSVGPHKEM
jgi:hypothetical protein